MATESKRDRWPVIIMRLANVERLGGKWNRPICYPAGVIPDAVARGAWRAVTAAAIAVAAIHCSAQRDEQSVKTARPAEPDDPLPRLRRACSSGDVLACPRVCLAGESFACTTLGKLGMDAPGRDPAETARWLRRGCDLHDPEACYLLATLGAAVPEAAVSPRSVEPLLREACERGHGPACLALGLEMEGQGQAPLAAAWFERGCELGAQRACFNLGVMHHQGIGVAQDLPRAVSLYQRACKAGEPVACADLGVMVREGQGTANDDARAVALFDQACRLGVGNACHNLALHYEEGRGVHVDATEAAALYERACSRDVYASCVNLAAMLEYGDGVPKDQARANALYRRACDAGLSAACEQVRGEKRR